MPYLNADLLRVKINEKGLLSEPFFFVIDYETSQGFFAENPLNQTEIFFKFLAQGNKPQINFPTKEVNLELIPNKIEEYKSKFDKLNVYFQNGEISLANLTDKTQIECNLTLDEIFACSTSMYQVYLPEKFVCFSPERFVKISKDGVISSNPMKGTIDANIPDAERLILEDAKEIQEHQFTVNLITDELSLVSDNVKTTRFRYIDRIKTNRKDLLQVSSEITGQLPADFKKRLGDIIFSLLPGGSIAGSPKQKVVEILKQIEMIPRGYYCGIAGYFDGNGFDSAVLIRYVEKDNDKLYFRSGGGITAKSICEKEYQEVLNKIYFPF